MSETQVTIAVICGVITIATTTWGVNRGIQKGFANLGRMIAEPIKDAVTMSMGHERRFLDIEREQKELRANQIQTDSQLDKIFKRIDDVYKIIAEKR